MVQCLGPEGGKWCSELCFSTAASLVGLHDGADHNEQCRAGISPKQWCQASQVWQSVISSLLDVEALPPEDCILRFQPGLRLLVSVRQLVLSASQTKARYIMHQFSHHHDQQQPEAPSLPEPAVAAHQLQLVPAASLKVQNLHMRRPHKQQPTRLQSCCRRKSRRSRLLGVPSSTALW